MAESKISKVAFSEVAPTLEIFPGVHAPLMADFERFSNGSLYMGMSSVRISVDGEKLGSMDSDISGCWFVIIGSATYKVPMKEVFSAFLEAHEKSAQ